VGFKAFCPIRLLPSEPIHPMLHSACSTLLRSIPTQPHLSTLPPNPDPLKSLKYQEERGGSLRGGTQKVFMFYSKTTFAHSQLFYAFFDPYLRPSMPIRLFCFRPWIAKEGHRQEDVLGSDLRTARISLLSPFSSSLWQKEMFSGGIQLESTAEKQGGAPGPRPWEIKNINKCQ